MNNKQTTQFVILNSIALVAVLVTNYLSQSLPLNGKTPGELSDDFPNLFVPAGLTFSIWGIIYFFLLAWVIAQIIALFKKNTNSAVLQSVDLLGWKFLLTCLLNIGWLFAWHWGQLLLSGLIMMNLLNQLININLSLYRSVAIAPVNKWITIPAFSIYQGWISVAFIANITAILVAFRWNGFGISDGLWATILIVIGGSVAVLAVLRRRWFFHGVAVAWAFLGIYLKRSELGDAPMVAQAALIVLGAVVVSILYGLWKGNSSTLPAA